MNKKLIISFIFFGLAFFGLTFFGNNNSSNLIMGNAILHEDNSLKNMNSQKNALDSNDEIL